MREISFKNLPVKFSTVLLAAVGLSIVLVFQTYSLTFQEGGGSISIVNHAILVFITYLLWALLIPVIYYLIESDFFKKESVPLKITGLIGTSIIISFGHMLISNVLYYIIQIASTSTLTFSGAINEFSGVIPGILFSRLIDYWIIFGILTTLDIYKKYNQKRVQLAEVKNELTMAQLNSLRMQLNPHFLFNSLNTISSLMDNDVETAQKMIAKVGYLLRTILDDSKDQFISLKDELLYVRTYLDIEQERFNDRLKIEYDIQEESLDYRVPNLILQPLVENAIKHGFSKQIGMCTISISSKIEKDSLSITVQDDGKGALNLKEIEQSAGIGISNTKERLHKIYGSNYDFQILSPKEKGFLVSIRIPLQHKMKWIVDAH